MFCYSVSVVDLPAIACRGDGAQISKLDNSGLHQTSHAIEPILTAIRILMLDKSGLHQNVHAIEPIWSLLFLISKLS